MQGAAASGQPPRTMMMQFFMGSPWGPKFKGTGSDIKLIEWKLQMQAMFRIQTFTDEQKINFVLGSLEGEILILAEQEHRTVQQIFDQLEQLDPYFLIADKILKKT